MINKGKFSYKYVSKYVHVFPQQELELNSAPTWIWNESSDLLPITTGKRTKGNVALCTTGDTWQLLGS